MEMFNDTFGNVTSLSSTPQTMTLKQCIGDASRVAYLPTDCVNASSLDYEEFDEESLQLQQVVKIVVPTFFGIIGLSGLLGNALVVLVVAANPQMRSTTNLLIINLAVADLLFVIFCVPFTATDYVLPSWPFGDLWCKFVQYMIVVTAHASIYTLVLMSLDRFLAVVHPIASMSIRTERNALFAIIFLWIIITTTAIPVAVTHGEVMQVWQGESNSACIFLYQDYNLVGFQVSFFLSSYVIPLALISMLYVAMLARLWKGAPGGRVSAESRRGKKRVTRMVVVVVLAFAICWLPIQLILVLKSLKLYETTTIKVIMQVAAHVLAYMNSCVNPFLYAFLSDNFRKAFRKVVWCLGPPSMHHGYGPATTNITKSTRAGNGTSHVDIL
ncbi:allatostatin-A receptor-like isoform X1 [Culicoides brevitarsis]|uniref:allatostatin-A receptor-like isoform X1 n=1 Tax=Culicoides brevitarsis TaxID=469753 RepID=UPI00307C92D1